jgi:hypothetical protein
MPALISGLRSSLTRLRSIQAGARPSKVDDRRHNMAVAERSTCRSEAACRATAHFAIVDYHIDDHSRQTMS